MTQLRVQDFDGLGTLNWHRRSGGFKFSFFGSLEVPPQWMERSEADTLNLRKPFRLEG